MQSNPRQFRTNLVFHKINSNKGPNANIPTDRWQKGVPATFERSSLLVADEDLTSENSNFPTELIPKANTESKISSSDPKSSLNSVFYVQDRKSGPVNFRLFLGLTMLFFVFGLILTVGVFALVRI